MKRIFLFLFLISVLTFSTLLICSAFDDISICTFIGEYAIYITAASLHTAFFSAALFFLWKKDLKSTLKAIAFPGDIGRNLLLSAGGFIAVIAVLMILGVVAQFFGLNDQQAVYDKVADLPIIILVFAIFLAPISEELFFRALLVPRIGMIFSSVLFGLMHFSYGSFMEIIGAALIGLVLAAMFRYSKSITPCLVIHIAYNFLSILVMKVFL